MPTPDRMMIMKKQCSHCRHFTGQLIFNPEYVEHIERQLNQELFETNEEESRQKADKGKKIQDGYVLKSPTG